MSAAPWPLGLAGVACLARACDLAIPPGPRKRRWQAHVNAALPVRTGPPPPSVEVDPTLGRVDRLCAGLAAMVFVLLGAAFLWVAWASALTAQ
ncbi:MAG: hypothetical protein RMK02_02435 [Burkholderiales bacterium]|nr:hypothetical protein [Burkholderiales bacterium]